MTKHEFHMLTTGDLVRHKGSGSAMVVHSNYGGNIGVIATRTQLLVNPDEWNLVSKTTRSDDETERQRIREAVEVAVAKERERCAQIAVAITSGE